MQRPNEAMADLRAAIENLSQYELVHLASAHLTMGQLWHNFGRSPNADEQFKQALHLAQKELAQPPIDAAARFELAIILQDLGQPDAALSASHQARRTALNNQDILLVHQIDQRFGLATRPNDVPSN